MAVMAQRRAEAIEKLVDYAIARDLIEGGDSTWAYNVLLGAIDASGPGPSEDWTLRRTSAEGTRPAIEVDLQATLHTLAEDAVARGVVEDTASARDRISMRIMGALTPRPSEVAERFKALAEERGPRSATDYFYGMCCDVGYVRREAIARNVRWCAPTRWGDLEITINLSKPEKDPREIAAAGKARPLQRNYPACQLCIENEGYPGRSADEAGGAHPARQNLRIVPIEMGGQPWGLQYSPYAYFSEHCIAMSAIHRPMHIDRAALACLLDFLDAIPHYFIGSNADLPIVGGSILSHDHFQGGAHEFPMMRAQVEGRFGVPAYPDVEFATLRWPLSVIRLRSANRVDLIDACVHVIDTWRGWSDESQGILSRTPDGIPHNTVTPIMRICEDATASSACAPESRYEVYLALRCNIASEAHPLGLFHPHAEYHHIKKENIGLIEVMGLAILPARLIDELDAVETHLVDAAEDTEDRTLAEHRLAEALASDPLSEPHAAWAENVFARHPDISRDTASQVLRDEVGGVFAGVLEDAGVFKWDEAGRAALQRFIDAL
ncbi:UTP-hexose-1-phosphate uridylyltransferase [Coriobacterium glomerans PW2]|uniref:Galactose-1-phosphate uridylyltransferase n=1 Tax=Coriobacterium glomerans (strain ATCC 49209 / DSM 20642 / JCM 10262 / PW2) TaxID=700015 RepID=F2N9B1_CORGP|nr:UTP-hexose-1-phosphate uridylyltransferase [Coriobacterium glomerans PW2]